MKKFILLFTAIGCTFIAANAQDFKMPAPSPAANLQQDFSTSNIEVKYSRPSVKGRKIFGEVVPFGKIWRTGANAATQISFGEDVKLNGNDIKKGTYALYTIPHENEWEVIINKGIGNWGASGFDTKDDVAKFKIKASKTTNFVETFTIDVNNITINSADIVISWENTTATINVKSDNNDRIVTYLENSINKPSIPYQQAANYYLETNQSLDKASAYADKAIAGNPNAFWLNWMKARILDKQGKKNEAIEAAKKAADAAKGSPYADEYQRNYESLKNAK